MDLAGFDGLLCSDNNTNRNHNNNNNNNSLISVSASSAYDFDPKLKPKPKPNPSGFKHEQSLSPSANPDDLLKGMLLRSNNNSSNSTYLSDSHNMLSFSSPHSHLSPTLPSYARNISGYGLRGVVAGVRGPFTPSQWMELEHQALIYKYITVNAPIPSNLLIPIRKALETAAFCSFPGTNLRHAAYGWGGFHMGFSNNSDPEPGRCRRTDGKKWRCSRDAVADQKYCERHMNRGRHRSRKPVEGQTGHSVTNGRTINNTNTASAAVVSSPATAATTAATVISHQINRNIGSDKIQDSIGLTQKGILVNSEFGFVCSDSLLNPLQKNDNLGQKPPNSLHQFMENWPHSDKTHLSISNSMTSSNFISSTTSPVRERPNLSPLRMGLGVGNNTTAHQVFDEMSKRGNWIPVSWESSTGGPLGEVLNHNAINGPSALNLMTDGWDSSQHMSLSPTGVLQKTGFGCFSNSSAGSSPRTDNNNNSLLGVGSTTLITSSSLPLL